MSQKNRFLGTWAIHDTNANTRFLFLSVWAGTYLLNLYDDGTGSKLCFCQMGPPGPSAKGPGDLAYGSVQADWLSGAIPANWPGPSDPVPDGFASPADLQYSFVGLATIAEILSDPSNAWGTKFRYDDTVNPPLYTGQAVLFTFLPPGQFCGIFNVNDGVRAFGWSGLPNPQAQPEPYTVEVVVPSAAFMRQFLNGTAPTSSDYSFIDLSGEDYSNLALQLANLNNSDLSGTDFHGCNLTQASFAGASLAGCHFSRTMLAGANLAGHDLTTVDVSAGPALFYDHTNPPPHPSPINPLATLAGCRLNQALLGNDWSLLDLTNATILNFNSPLSSQAQPLVVKYSTLLGVNGGSLAGLTLKYAVFDGSILDRVDLSGADLTSASLIQASMHGVNLTNAILPNANLRGAQLGTLSRLFTLPLADQSLLNKAPAIDPALNTAFTQNGITLSATANLQILDPERVWSLNDTGNNIVYSIRLETQSDSTQTLTVYKPANPASLANAYLPGAILTGANLFAITANNIQFYNAVVDGSVILEDAQINDSNLSGVNFTQAQLQGVNLSGSYLFDAIFKAANLSPSASGAAVDLGDANLQGADFTDAVLHGANLANAAVAINVPTTADPKQGGVYLFSLPFAGDSTACAQYEAELNAAATVFSLNPDGSKALYDAFIADLQAGKVAPFIPVFASQTPPIRLSTSAVISPDATGVWQIVDGANSYTLWSDPDDEGAMELYAAPSIPLIEAGFTHARYPLRSQASVSIDTAGQQWLIDNDSENPSNTNIGYMQFILKLNGSVLDVYGAALRILRLDANSQLVYDTENCNVTTLTLDNFDGDTICPNGKKLSVNQTPPGMPRQPGMWDETWMRAGGTLPSPPTCVPTLNNWCPPNSPSKLVALNSAGPEKPNQKLDVFTSTDRRRIDGI